MEIFDDLGQHSLATREGFTAFTSQGIIEPPELLSAADLIALTDPELDIYNDVRQRFHSQLLLVATPDIMRVTAVGQKLIRNNRGKQLGRKGLAVVGAAGTGKSTCITQLGKKHQIDQQRRAPGLQGRIPVAYIVAPHEATPVKLSLELAAFLGLPVNRWDGEPYITRAVVSVLRKVGCGLVLVDEIQRVELGTADGAKAADYLKYLFDSIPATFVFAGTPDLTLFDGPRGQQFASRFKTITTTAFGYGLKAHRELWDKLVVSMEEPLRLHKHRPGMLLEYAHYLHSRTGGMIGSLDQLIHDAANDAIADGTEKITKKHLDEVLLDTTAEQQYSPVPHPRPATAGMAARRRGRP
ncbi:TniB family NTP-binding protein [Streptosporangium sp. NPDC006013]|uniref:TniB family NTP-binding protein n=1 Tax=Streptosporangium sp. NPDC006013 TaxID=3155596 RepID=UPI0033A0E41E